MGTVTTVFQVNKVNQVQKVHQVLQVSKVESVHQVLQVTKVKMVHQVLPVLAPPTTVTLTLDTLKPPMFHLALPDTPNSGKVTLSFTPLVTNEPSLDALSAKPQPNLLPFTLKTKKPQTAQL